MSDWLIDNPFFYDNAYIFMTYFGWITKVVWTLFFIGVFTDKPSLYLTVNFFIKILLSLFLIYRFNSYRSHKIHFTELDRKICYSVGTYMLMFSFLDIIQSYVERLRHLVNPYTTPVVERVKRLIWFKEVTE